MTAIALPLTRKRKRRRPTRREREAMFWFIANICTGAFNLGVALHFARWFNTINLVMCAYSWGIAREVFWPLVRNYIVNGWEDE